MKQPVPVVPYKITKDGQVFVEVEDIAKTPQWREALRLVREIEEITRRKERCQYCGR